MIKLNTLQNRLYTNSDTFMEELDGLIPVFYRRLSMKGLSLSATTNTENDTIAECFDFRCFDVNDQKIVKKEIWIIRPLFKHIYEVYDSINEAQKHTAELLLREWYSKKVGGANLWNMHPYFDRFLQFAPDDENPDEWLRDILQNWMDYASECEWDEISKIYSSEDLFHYISTPSKCLSFIMQAHGFDERLEYVSTSASLMMENAPRITAKLRYREYGNADVDPATFKCIIHELESESQIKALRDVMMMANDDLDLVREWGLQPISNKTIEAMSELPRCTSYNLQTINFTFSVPIEEIYWDRKASSGDIDFVPGMAFGSVSQFKLPNRCGSRPAFYKFDIPKYPYDEDTDPSEIEFIARVFPYCAYLRTNQIEMLSPIPVHCVGVTREEFANSVIYESLRCLWYLFKDRKYRKQFPSDPMYRIDSVDYLLENDERKEYRRNVLYPDILEMLGTSCNTIAFIERYTAYHQMLYGQYYSNLDQQVKTHLYIPKNGAKVFRAYRNPKVKKYQRVLGRAEVKVQIIKPEMITKYQKYATAIDKKKAIAEEDADLIKGFAMDILYRRRKYIQLHVPFAKLGISEYKITAKGDVIISVTYLDRCKTETPSEG